MKVTLEKVDLVRILSTTLGYPIAEEDVEVQADPFEVHIRSVNVEEMAQQQTPPPPPEDDVPDPEDVPTEPVNPVMTMADILRQNETMAGGIAPPRPLGPEESDDPPPISEAELMAAGRKYE